MTPDAAAQEIVATCPHTPLVGGGKAPYARRCGACSDCIATALSRARMETLTEVAKYRCAGCRDGVAFVSNEHGVLRPRGHVTTGILGVHYGYCTADWEHDQIRALAEESRDG